MAAYLLLTPNMNRFQRMDGSISRLSPAWDLKGFLRRSGLPAGWLFIAAFLISPAYSESIEYGLQNPLLRAHFRARIINMASTPGSFGGRGYKIDLRSLERDVDRLATHYLRELDKKIAALRHSYDEVATLRQALLTTEEDLQTRRRLLRDWRERFDDLEDSADDLKDAVRMVLPWVKGKTDFNPELLITADNPAFETEIAYIGTQIEQAEKRIREFFFTPNHTVTVTELSGDNMLIRLFRVEKLSKEIKTSL